MIAALLVLSVCIVMLLVLLLLACMRIERLYKMNMDQTVAHVRGVFAEEVDSLWSLVRAQVLRDAAEAWPKVDAEAERKRLSWTPAARGADSPSMVVLWLNNRADRIEKGETLDGDD